MTTPTSVFAKISDKLYEHRFDVTLRVGAIAGGTPSDTKVAEGWIRTKLGIDNEEQIQAMAASAVAERMLEGEAADAALESAVEEVVALKHLNGFKRNPDGLYIEGRQVKAAIREAANIRWPSDRWGPTKKGTKSFWAEHVFVPEDLVHLTRDGEPLAEADEVVQRFVRTRFGSGIQYEEVCRNVDLSFTVITDHKFTPTQWGELWSVGENNGIGASRSQGFGTYVVTRWDAQ